MPLSKPTPPAVLIADPDRDASLDFSDRSQGRFRVLTASTTDEALALLSDPQNAVGVLLCGWELLDAAGRPLLSLAKEKAPEVLRILLTPTSEKPPSLEGLQANGLYLSFPRPLDFAAVEAPLLRALEHHRLLRDRAKLDAERRVVLHRILVMDRVLSLGALSTELGLRLRHVLPALQSFMDLSSPTLEAPEGVLAGLLEKSRWKDHRDRSRSERLALDHVLNEMGHSARPFLPTFNDQVSLHGCLEEALERHQTRLAENGLRVTNDIPRNLPTLKADGPLLDRMMDALFDEALTAHPSGMTLTFSGVKETDQVVRLQVACGDPGFRPERLRWVFDPFQPLPQGAPKPGLHLVSAFLVVYHHGGVAHSTLQGGGGRVLRFHLPVDPDKLIVTEGSRNFLNHLVFTESMWEEFLGDGN